MKRTGAALALCAALLGACPMMSAMPASAGVPKGACRDPEPAHPTERMLPWAQQQLKPQRAWPFSDGTGVTVAVIDSGVDADHPQLSRPGKVLRGRDFYLVGTLPGNYDCISHGTGVAGIIAADGRSGIGFQGIAPGARILPVRVSEREADETGQTQLINPGILAQGIKYAVDQGAQVINLSMAGGRDQKAIRQAVAYAVAHDVVVVAAVGNRQTADARLPSYPASYPGVVGVGAVDIAGARASASQIGQYVDLVAPGVGVLTTTRVDGQAYQDGTSYAAPFVAGTVALIRSAWPKLTAAQVIQRLLATATPARGGQSGIEYGAGIVDPYRAVTEGMTPKGRAAPAMVVPPSDHGQLAVAAWWRSRGVDARHAALASAGGLLIVLLLASILLTGRRRRWAAARRPLTADTHPQTDIPPDNLFTDR